MHLPTILLTVLLPALTTPSPLFLSPRGSTGSTPATCAPVHVITVRGSLEPQGVGALGSLLTLIEKAHPAGTITNESLVYPATIFDYAGSSTMGTAALKTLLEKYTLRCPSAELVLLGYSQGAHVVGDALCGGGGVFGDPYSKPVGKGVGERVSAVVMYGDPRFLKGMLGDRGNNTSRDGIFPRPANISCHVFAARTRSYCDLRDPFCADGDRLKVHLTYPSRYDNAAAKFVGEKLAG